MDRTDACAGQEAGAKVAHREKRWNELGIEEKVERLRMALRMTNERAVSGQRIAIEASDIARRHEHGGHGAVVMPAEGGMNRPLLTLGGREVDAAEYVERMLA